MLRKIARLGFLLFLLPAAASAQSKYYGVTLSTVTGKASMSLAGQELLYPSTQQMTTPSIILQGNGGRITATGGITVSSATVKGNASITGTVTAAGFSGPLSGNVSAPTVTATYGVSAATGNFTATGAAQYSVTASSGVSIGSGGLKFPDATVQTSAVNGLWTTWTPTLSCGSGTGLVATSTGSYIAIGHIVIYSLSVSITTNGTCGTWLGVSLPFTTVVGGVLMGRDNVTGKLIMASSNSGYTGAFFFNYDNTYPGSSGDVLAATGILVK